MGISKLALLGIVFTMEQDLNKGRLIERLGSDLMLKIWRAIVRAVHLKKS